MFSKLLHADGILGHTVAQYVFVYFLPWSLTTSTCQIRGPPIEIRRACRLSGRPSIYFVFRTDVSTSQKLYMRKPYTSRQIGHVDIHWEIHPAISNTVFRRDNGSVGDNGSEDSRICLRNCRCGCQTGTSDQDVFGHFLPLIRRPRHLRFQKWQLNLEARLPNLLHGHLPHNLHWYLAIRRRVWKPYTQKPYASRQIRHARGHLTMYLVRILTIWLLGGATALWRCRECQHLGRASTYMESQHLQVEPALQVPHRQFRSNSHFGIAPEVLGGCFGIVRASLRHRSGMASSALPEHVTAPSDDWKRTHAPHSNLSHDMRDP